MCVSWFSPCFVLRRVPALLARVQRTPALKLCVGDAETTILAVGRPSVPEAAVRIEEEVAHAPLTYAKAISPLCQCPVCI
jgi:hypothetical protein